MKHPLEDYIDTAASSKNIRKRIIILSIVLIGFKGFFLGINSYEDLTLSLPFWFLPSNSFFSFVISYTAVSGKYFIILLLSITIYYLLATYYLRLVDEMLNVRGRYLTAKLDAKIKLLEFQKYNPDADSAEKHEEKSQDEKKLSNEDKSQKKSKYDDLDEQDLESESKFLAFRIAEINKYNTLFLSAQAAINILVTISIAVIATNYTSNEASEALSRLKLFQGTSFYFF